MQVSIHLIAKTNPLETNSKLQSGELKPTIVFLGFGEIYIV